MKGVTFNVSVPHFLLAKTAGRISDSALYGLLSGVKMSDLPEPQLPGPDWVEIEVVAGGICGSDISNLTYSASPAMEPFGSFPAVLGHEILGRVKSVGTNVSKMSQGQRVTVDPMISCTTRGYPPEDPCSSCSEGLHCTCERAGEDGVTLIGDEPLSRGLTIGYHRDLPGGWGQTVLAHESQVFPVDDALSDNAAVLLEPLSIALHAVLRTPPEGEEPAFVIGSGTIALATIWALRATGFQGPILAQAKREHEQKLARTLGATDVVAPGFEARDALIDTGASAYMPVVGPEVFSGGGFPLIYDCVGNQGSLAQSLGFASPRGRIVVIGCVAEFKKLDLTFVWARELRIRGAVGYGLETWRGERRHTFEIAHDLLLETGAPVQNMVTHAYPLDQYRDALRAAANHRKSGAVKVVLQP
jgi:threonine dehydrogenase-like Zn-dependent dehydrogenase